MAASILQQVAATIDASSVFPGACTSGSKLICVVTTEDDTENITVSDSAAQSWTVDVTSTAQDSGVRGRVFIASCQNTSTSALTVSISGFTDRGFMKIYEVSGLDSGAALDQSGVKKTDVNNANTVTPSITLTGCLANDFIVAGICQGNATIGMAADSGYTLTLAETLKTFLYHGMEYIVDSGASGNKTLNWNGATTPVNKMAMAVAAYKLPGGGGGSPALMGQACL